MVALEAVALVVVLRGQDAAALSLIRQTTQRADDVTDPPAGAWLTITTPTTQVSSRGLPSGFPRAGRHQGGRSDGQGADQRRARRYR